MSRKVQKQNSYGMALDKILVSNISFQTFLIIFNIQYRLLNFFPQFKTNIIKYNMQKEEDFFGMESLLQMIVVSKEREEEYDQEIDKQWKEARSNFFNYTVQHKLSQSQIPQKHQMEIVKGFKEAIQDLWSHRLTIDLKKEQLCKYKQQIEQLKKQFNLINQQFSRRQKETPAITQIIQLKLTELRVISIQYSLNISFDYRYELSAFQLFKIVHENRELSSVTLKGILIKSFKLFIKAMTKSKTNQTMEKEKWSWMNDFKPSNSLKIAINPEDQFQLTHQKQHFCVISDLAQFGGLFQQMSLISVSIRLSKFKKQAKVKNSLQIIQKQLKILGKLKLKIQIQGGYAFTDETVFTSILQMLSLTPIAQLKFREIKFNPQLSINRFLAMEQIINTIFENNTVTYLKLHQCSNFLILPTITTLQAIDLQSTTFRRQFNFISKLTQTSSLQSITYSIMDQEIKIEEQLFNRLQRLQISECQTVILDISAHSPSKIKYLTLIEANIQSVDGLFVLFSKLTHITQLVLSSIDFGNQLICTIPSSHLRVLAIQINNQFANRDLQAIDKKWPQLRQLTLWDCPNLNERVWSACQFKGLRYLQRDHRILSHGHNLRKQLRKRGIKVY